ncbi:hypothetical protein ACFE04_029165 [Oxalis oulophora]
MSSRRFASNIPNLELGCLIRRSCKKTKAVSICKFGAIEVSKVVPSKEIRLVVTSRVRSRASKMSQMEFLGILVFRLSSIAAASTDNGREGARSWGDVAHPREIRHPRLLFFLLSHSWVRGDEELLPLYDLFHINDRVYHLRVPRGLSRGSKVMLGQKNSFTVYWRQIVHNMGSLLANFMAQICNLHLGSVHRALFYGFQYSSDEELYVSLCVILTSLFGVIHVPSDLVQYYMKMMAHPDEKDTNRKGSPYYLAISEKDVLELQPSEGSLKCLGVPGTSLSPPAALRPPAPERTYVLYGKVPTMSFEEEEEAAYLPQWEQARLGRELTLWLDCMSQGATKDPEFLPFRSPSILLDIPF